MAIKRSKEELYGHDPELKRAVEDLTQAKESEDPMYLAPPEVERGPAFDANRFQQKTAPPGFLEFARTAVSPALKLEQEQPKAPKPRPAASIAGVPVYSAPMAPPIANEQTLEASPVLLAGGVTAEADPRRADTLLKIRIAAPQHAADEAVIVPSSLTKRAHTQRSMRRSLAVVLLLALVILGVTLALSPTARVSDPSAKGKTPVDGPAATNANKSVEPSPASTTPAAVAATPPAPSQALPIATSSTGVREPVDLKQTPSSAPKQPTPAPTAVRAGTRPRLESARASPTTSPTNTSGSATTPPAAPTPASDGFFSTAPVRPPAD